MLHIHFAIDNIFSQLRRFIVSILLITISLILLVLSVLAYDGMNYSYASSDAILAQGMEGTGVLTIDLGQENTDKFLEETYKRNEIYSIGSVQIWGTQAIGELLDIQCENTEGYFVADSGYLSVMGLDVRGIDLCELNLSEGITPEQLDFSMATENNYINYLYLGSAYESISVGTEYEFEMGDFVATYIVAGIMEDGQRWIDPNIDTEIGMNTLDYTIDCTYGIFMIGNLEQSENKVLITASDGYTIDEALEAAHKVATKYGIEMRSLSLTEQYAQECKPIITILSYLKETLIVVIPAIMLMLITSQIVSVMLELNSYGIMCSMGFSIKDINIMLIIKNIIMAVISFAIVVPIVIWFASNWFEQDMQYIMKTILLTSALPVAIIVVLAVILITSVTSVVILKRYTPVKLMGTRN